MRSACGWKNWTSRRWLAALVLLASILLTSAAAIADEPVGPPIYADKARLLVYRDAMGSEHAVASVADWQRRREHILLNFQEAAGPVPDAARRCPLDVRVQQVEEFTKYQRQKLSYASEPGDRVPAFLLLPRPAAGAAATRLPAVLCLHQTSKHGKGEPVGLGGSDNLHYASELAERGFVTLAVDYPNYGEYQFDPYAHGYASATMKGIWNHRRAVDLLTELPQVDPQRIGVIGHSLGGHNSIFAAVFDERIRCTVSSCGFNSFPHYYGGNLAGWSHDGYMPRIRQRYHTKPEEMPFDFTELVGALAPRAFLAVSPLRDANFDVEGVFRCLEAARPVYELHGVGERLAALHPDCEHDFPPEIREQAYAFLARMLAPQ